VAECKSAGITPVMITGDHPGTARAIASPPGDRRREDAEVMTGSGARSICPTMSFRSRVEEIRARLCPRHPEQKIRIVKALQARGQFWP
jgi:Ca2+-transporting ATPase